MDRNEKQLTEITVTPLITHAVNVLRAAVPRHLVQAGAIGINVDFNEFGFEGGVATIEYSASVRRVPTATLKITDVQQSAAWMLVGIAAFYEALWRRACGIDDIDEDKEPIPPRFLALKRRFDENLWRKLNSKIGGGVASDIDLYLHGSVTVYL